MPNYEKIEGTRKSSVYFRYGNELFVRAKTFNGKIYLRCTRHKKKCQASANVDMATDILSLTHREHNHSLDSDTVPILRLCSKLKLAAELSDDPIDYIFEKICATEDQQIVNKINFQSLFIAVKKRRMKRKEKSLPVKKRTRRYFSKNSDLKTVPTGSYEIIEGKRKGSVNFLFQKQLFVKDRISDVKMRVKCVEQHNKCPAYGFIYLASNIFVAACNDHNHPINADIIAAHRLRCQIKYLASNTEESFESVFNRCCASSTSSVVSLLDIRTLKAAAQKRKSLPPSNPYLERKLFLQSLQVENSTSENITHESIPYSYFESKNTPYIYQSNATPHIKTERIDLSPAIEEVYYREPEVERVENFNIEEITPPFEQSNHELPKFDDQSCEILSPQVVEQSSSEEEKEEDEPVTSPDIVPTSPITKPSVSFKMDIYLCKLCDQYAVGEQEILQHLALEHNIFNVNKAVFDSIVNILAPVTNTGKSGDDTMMCNVEEDIEDENSPADEPKPTLSSPVLKSPKKGVFSSSKPRFDSTNQSKPHFTDRVKVHVKSLPKQIVARHSGTGDRTWYGGLEGVRVVVSPIREIKKEPDVVKKTPAVALSKNLPKSIMNKLMSNTVGKARRGTIKLSGDFNTDEQLYENAIENVGETYSVKKRQRKRKADEDDVLYDPNVKDTSQIKFICRACKRSFQRRSQLVRHKCYADKLTDQIAGDALDQALGVEDEVVEAKLPSPQYVPPVEELSETEVEIRNDQVQRSEDGFYQKIVDPKSSCIEEGAFYYKMSSLQASELNKLAQLVNVQTQIEGEDTDKEPIVLEMYQCLQCKALCENRDLLIDHLATHRLGFKFCCKFCPDRWRFTHPSLADVLSHCRISHPHRANYSRCESCNFDADDDQDMDQHVSSHHPYSDLYVCRFCDENFGLSVVDLVNHLKSHHTDQETQAVVLENAVSAAKKRFHSDDLFECQQCEKLFFREEHIERHRLYAHNGYEGHEADFVTDDEIVGLLTCSLCLSYQTYDVPELINHISNHSTISCTLCKLEVDSGPPNFFHLLINHIIITHNAYKNQEAAGYMRRLVNDAKLVFDCEESFDCDKCPRIYFTSSALEQHKLDHDRWAKEATPCEVCGEKRRTARSIAQHCRVHKFIYFCSLCVSFFPSSNKLRLHLSEQHAAGDDGCAVDSLMDECLSKSLLLSTPGMPSSVPINLVNNEVVLHYLEGLCELQRIDEVDIVKSENSAVVPTNIDVEEDQRDQQNDCSLVNEEELLAKLNSDEYVAIAIDSSMFSDGDQPIDTSQAFTLKITDPSQADELLNDKQDSEEIADDIIDESDPKQTKEPVAHSNESDEPNTETSTVESNTNNASDNGVVSDGAVVDDEAETKPQSDDEKHSPAVEEENDPMDTSPKQSEKSEEPLTNVENDNEPAIKEPNTDEVVIRLDPEVPSDAQGEEFHREIAPDSLFVQCKNHMFLYGLICNSFSWMSSLVLEKLLESYGVYECDLCGKLFNQVNRLQFHRRLHNKEENFMCDRCDHVSLNRNQARAHEDRNHGTHDLTCSICGFYSTSRLRFGVHLKKHAEKSNITCSSCTFTTDKDRKMRDHIRQEHPHMSMGEINLILGDTSRKRRIASGTGADLTNCPECNKTMKPSMLDHHMRTLHAVGEFKCPDCNFSTNAAYNLARHKRQSHKTQSTYKCPVCAHNLRAETSLVAHILNTHIKSNICPQCGHKSRNRTEFHCHMLIHSERKTFACNICPAVMLQESKMEEHFESKHHDEKLQYTSFVNENPISILEMAKLSLQSSVMNTPPQQKLPLYEQDQQASVLEDEDKMILLASLDGAQSLADVAVKQSPVTTMLVTSAPEDADDEKMLESAPEGHFYILDENGQAVLVPSSVVKF